MEQVIIPGVYLVLDLLNSPFNVEVAPHSAFALQLEQFVSGKSWGRVQPLTEIDRHRDALCPRPLSPTWPLPNEWSCSSQSHCD
eukprot:4224906-Amphidinium_carterae.1